MNVIAPSLLCRELLRFFALFCLCFEFFGMQIALYSIGVGHIVNSHCQIAICFSIYVKDNLTFVGDGVGTLPNPPQTKFDFFAVFFVEMTVFKDLNCCI